MDIELLIAFLSVDQPRPGMVNPKQKEWETLFDFYNEYSGEKRLHMSCAVCFPKVWYFCKSFLKNEAVEILKPKDREIEKQKVDEFRANNIV